MAGWGRGARRRALLTACGYVVHWQVVHVSHVTDGREDDKAGQDAGKRVDGRHHQGVPGLRREDASFQPWNCGRSIVEKMILDVILLGDSICTWGRCCCTCCNWPWKPWSQSLRPENWRPELLHWPKPARGDGGEHCNVTLPSFSTC